MVLPDNGLFGAIALNRYAVGNRPADREVTRVRDYEIRFLSTAFPMSALPLIATTERTCHHVRNVPISDMQRLLDHLSGTHQQSWGNRKSQRVCGL
jgi:hypothetical protein